MGPRTTVDGRRNRLVERFAELRRRREAGLVVYLTCGDPSVAETVELVIEAARAGADVIELGVPFSDPAADGPVIQRAMARALERGLGIDTIGQSLAVVRAVRAETEVPIVLFGYANPLLQYGLPRVVDEAVAAGVDGLLVVDLPPDDPELDELDPLLPRDGRLCRIVLLAPTTSDARVQRIVERGSGFAYYVSLTGVTGASHLDLGGVERKVAALRPLVGELPLAIGFGVREEAEAARLGACADAVVVGSALVEAIATAPPAERRSTVAKWVQRFKAAVRSSRDRAA